MRDVRKALQTLWYGNRDMDDKIILKGRECHGDVLAPENVPREGGGGGRWRGIIVQPVRESLQDDNWAWEFNNKNSW